MAAAAMLPDNLATAPGPSLLPGTAAPDNEPEVDLLLRPENETHKKAAIELAKHFIGLDKWVRRQEVIECRRARFYWRGDQYIYWKSDSIGFIPAVGGSSIPAGDSQVEISRYTDVYNIYTPYGESVMATLIQNPPGINWQPQDPSNPEDVTASQLAGKLQQKIENDNDRKNLQTDIARLMYTDGRIVLLNEHKDTETGSIELTKAYGVLESKCVPITANCQADLVALFLSTEIDIYQAKEEYPDIADDIKEGTSSMGETSYERIARLGVLQGTRMLMQAGDAFSHMVTKHKVFLRPSTFRRIEKGNREFFEQNYGKGLYVVVTGDTLCESNNISMDDCTTVGFATPGDGMSRPALGKRMIPLQDTFNDELNLWHEAHDFCVPTIFMYSESGEIDAVRDQISQPGAIIPITALPPGATSAEAAFYASVLESVPSTLPQLLEFIQGPLAQFITGAFPALFGGDTGTNDTAKGISIQRDAAMGRMGISWASMQQMYANVMQISVRSAVANSEEGAQFSFQSRDIAGNQVSEDLSIDALKAGSFKCVADMDASFPESTNAKRQTYQMMMTSAERNPILADTIAQPENQEYGHELIGLPDLIVPGAEASNKQLNEIALLLKEDPVAPSQQEMMAAAEQQAAAGQPQLAQALLQWNEQAKQAQAAQESPPPPPIPDNMYQPSVKVDPDCDMHQYEWPVVQKWMSSPDGIKQKTNNPKGFMNVRLHGLMHKMLIPPPPGAVPPGGPNTGGSQEAKQKAEAAPKSSSPQPQGSQ